MSKLLKELQRAGLVRSVRGAHGGYQLARATAEINAADIIDAVEGPVAMTECSNGSGLCGIEATCLVGHGWQRISLAIRRALTDVSLDELLRRDLPPIAPAVQAGAAHAGAGADGTAMSSQPDRSRIAGRAQVPARLRHGHPSPNASPPGLDEDVIRADLGARRTSPRGCSNGG